MENRGISKHTMNYDYEWDSITSSVLDLYHSYTNLAHEIIPTSGSDFRSNFSRTFFGYASAASYTGVSTCHARMSFEVC